MPTKYHKMTIVARMDVPRSLERAFGSLPEEDRAMLRAWFGVPLDSSTREACRVLLKRAPTVVLEAIEQVRPG